MQELMQRYEESIKLLDKYEEWARKNNLIWEKVYTMKFKAQKGREDVISYKQKRDNLIKEIEHIQKDIHSHLATI